MSKAVPLKLKENIFEDTEKIRSHFHVTRNAYINEAVDYFNAIKKRALLRDKLRHESALVRRESMRVLSEFEALDDHGL
jgi:hypothetical protein